VHPRTGRRTYDRFLAKSSEPLVMVISPPPFSFQSTPRLRESCCAQHNTKPPRWPADRRRKDVVG
jgi:hypothetical protein